MTEQASSGTESSSPARSIVGLVVANTSLIAAILIYMGWSYDNAMYGEFHLSPLDLGLGPQDYALRSLSLFSPVIVIVAVLFIVVIAVRSGDLDDAGKAVRSVLLRACRALLPTITEAVGDGDGDGDGRPSADAGQAAARPAFAEGAERPPVGNQAGPTVTQSALPRNLAIGAGISATIIGLALSWIATRANVSTVLVLALLGGGPLLLTWPARARRQGRVPYALALVIAAVCALWAGSVYAQQKGDAAAQNVIHDPSSTSAVVIYSTQRLALSGGDIEVTPLTAATAAPYRYEYAGLRLLLVQSGTYYLLPAHWTPEHDFTYVVYASDDMRIVLY
jgi:hypothetical protein